MDADEAALDKQIREGLHALGAPRELGSHLGTSLSETAKELLEEDLAAVVQRNGERLRAHWGADYDRNFTAVEALVEAAPAGIREIAVKHPELYSSVQTMSYLLLQRKRSAQYGSQERCQPPTDTQFKIACRECKRRRID